MKLLTHFIYLFSHSLRLVVVASNVTRFDSHQMIFYEFNVRLLHPLELKKKLEYLYHVTFVFVIYFGRIYIIHIGQPHQYSFVIFIFLPCYLYSSIFDIDTIENQQNICK